MTRRIGFIGLVAAGCLLAGFMVAPVHAASGEMKYKVSVEYFDWTAGRGGMDYAIAHDPDDNYIGDVYALDPDSDGGFRIGFELTQGQVTWMAGYTSWEYDQEDEVTDTSNGLSGTLMLDDFCVACQDFEFATAGIDQDYSMLNLGFGYQLRPDSKFGVQVLGGLMFGSIEEEFDVLYSIDPSVTMETEIITQKNELDAFGFNIGLVPSYEFNSYVSLFGRFNYSPMMADTDRSFVYRTGGSGTSNLDTDVDVEISDEGVIHTVNLAMGAEITPIEWLVISVGYESEMWLNYPGFLKVTSESGEETIDRGGDDISFDGWFLRAGFEF